MTRTAVVAGTGPGLGAALARKFAAAGYVLHQKAREAGLGHQLPTDWFTETIHP